MVPAYFLLVSLFISCLEAAPQRDSYDTSALTGQKWPPYKNAGEGYWRQQDWEKEAFEEASKDTQKVVKKNTPKRPNTTKAPQRSSSSQGNRNKGQTG